MAYKHILWASMQHRDFKYCTIKNDFKLQKSLLASDVEPCGSRAARSKMTRPTHTCSQSMHQCSVLIKTQVQRLTTQSTKWWCWLVTFDLTVLGLSGPNSPTSSHNEPMGSQQTPAQAESDVKLISISIVCSYALKRDLIFMISSYCYAGCNHFCPCFMR